MKKVLIVEDEPAISRLLKRRLKSLGFEPVCVNQIKEAKSYLEKETFEYIFLDYILEDGRSKDLAEERYLKPTDSIFLMSAFMDDLEKEDFKELNVVYLKKPFKDLSSILSDMKSYFEKEGA